MATEDTLKTLEAAGFNTQQIPDKQREVLTTLSQDEVQTLVAIKRRLDAATGGEVSGYAAGAGAALSDRGAIFW